MRKQSSRFCLLSFALLFFQFLSGCSFLKLYKYHNDVIVNFSSGNQKFLFDKNQIFLTTSLDSIKEKRFLFDLGAAASSIFIDSESTYLISNKTPLKGLAKAVSADGKKLKQNYYCFDSIHTNLFKIEHALIASVNRPDKYTCNDISGLFGAELFAPDVNGKGNKIIQLNMSDSTFRIYDTLPATEGWIKLESSCNKFLSLFKIKLKIGNNFYDFLFDTGFSGGLAMSYADYKKMAMEADSLFNDQTIYGHIINTLSGSKYDTAYIAKTSIEINLNLVIDSVNVFTTKSLPISIIGMDVLRRFNILVDYKSYNIYIRPVNLTYSYTANFFKLKGFTPAYMKNRGFCVQNIFANSPAEQVGIKVGDEIISINEINSDKYSPCEISEVMANIKNQENGNIVTVKRGTETLSFRL